MHQTVFFGWGLLIALGALLGLTRLKKAIYPNVVLSFALVLGSASLGAAGLGFLISGGFALSSIGAIALGGLSTYIFIPYFNPSEKDLARDIIVSSSMLGLLVTRVGCVVNECDFGAPTNIFFGVHFDAPGNIWRYHQMLGISDAYVSHAVYPFPWMIIIPGALLFAFVWLKDVSRKTEWIVLGYIAIRIFAEFFRDPITSISVGGVQIGLALGALGFFLVQKIIRKQTTTKT